jgi:hypothetical protein
MTFVDMWMFEDGPKAIEDCSREELLIIVRYLVREYEKQLRPESIRANALGRVEMMKRGETHVGS